MGRRTAGSNIAGYESMYVRSVAVWFALMMLAIVNGAGREILMTPFMGPQAGHVLSTITLCVLILLTAWISIRWIGPAGVRDAVLIGLTWVVLTLAFEFVGGHFLFGAPWKELLADYNLFAGRIWPLVPLTTLLSPIGAYRLRRRAEHGPTTP